MAFVVQEMCDAHRRRHPPRLRRARAAALRQGVGLVRRGRPVPDQPRHADRRVRRDPRRPRLLPPRLGRRRRRSASRSCCSRSAAGATGAGSAPCSASRSSTGCSSSPRSSSNRTSARSPARCPSPRLPHGSFNTLLLLIASTIGATVTPWMIFFQQSASADKGMTPARRAPRPLRHRARRRARGDLRDRRARSPARRCCRTAARASRASPARASRRRSTKSPAAPPGRCSRSGSSRPARVAILTISASTAYAAGECVGVVPQLQHLPPQRRRFLRGQHRRRPDRRRGDPDPRRAAALDRAQRERARDRAAARQPGVRADARQRPRADGPVGQPALHERDRDRRDRRSSRVCGAAYGDRLLPADVTGGA